MRQEFEAENEGINIPTQVKLLVNPQTISKRRQNGKIGASSFVFLVMESKAAWFIQEGQQDGGSVVRSGNMRAQTANACSALGRVTPRTSAVTSPRVGTAMDITRPTTTSETRWNDR
jgi:hypothetical protein